MPAKTPKINLYRRKTMDDTPVGRITSWAITYGRYIMVGTEIIVLLAFIYRFKLDRKITDLREEVGQKQVILQANQPFEKEFRTLQKKLITLKTMVSDQEKPIDAIQLIQQLVPIDVYIETLEYQKDRININAVAGSTNGFSQFLVNMQAAKQIGEIEVGDISKQPLVGIQFKLSANLSK
ncbi:PilN domain-containing protein [Patescibacteria group bacterium]